MNSQLRRAARLWGLQTGFQNADQKEQAVSEKTLRSLLGSLCEFQIASDDDLAKAVKLAHQRRFEETMPPVLILTKGEPFTVRVSLPKETWQSEVRVRILPEASEQKPAELSLSEWTPSGFQRVLRFESRERIRKEFVLPSTALASLRNGYHRLELVADDRVLASSFILARPPKAIADHPKQWGLFAPVYALKSETNFGMGDVRDLERMQDFVHSQGGDFFGTLPLLSAVNEGESADPSPYSPVSRLFWNEIYLDVESLSQTSAKARAVVQGKEFQQELQSLREKELVDYKRVFALKKRVIEVLAQEFFEHSLPEDYEAFLQRQPLVEAYSKFRAKSENSSAEFHLYAQYKMDAALRLLSKNALEKKTAGLYLDFPIGVSRTGFDAELYKSSFLMDVSAGAPPDLLFHGGQDWGFAPLHPLEIRKTGYDYIRNCLRANLQFASVLRLDHIMGFFRIYVVPKGFSPKEGGYIRYRAEELFAVLAIEGERSKARVIGEDLGTVPDRVRELILENDAVRMWVYYFEAGDSPSKAIRKIPSQTLACLNTHDLIPFAGYLKSRDTQIFHELGFLEKAEATKQEADRVKTVADWKKDLSASTPMALLNESVRRLGQSDAEFVLVNIEDLWEETEPQNVPGTWKQVPNWQEKLKLSLAELEAQPALLKPLKTLSEERP